MSRSNKKKKEISTHRKNRRRKKSYTSEEETEETEESSQTTTTDESTPRYEKQKKRRSKSLEEKKRPTFSDEELTPRKRKRDRSKSTGKRKRSGSKHERSDKRHRNYDDNSSINSRRMVSIPSPSIDPYDIISNTTETSELPPQPPQKKERNRNYEKNEKQPERKTSKRSTKKSPRIHKSKSKVKGKNSPRGKYVKDKATLPSCPLCSKSYDCPILLPCSHTFCKECVTVFVETSDGKLFNCPVCSTRVSLQGEDEELFCPNFIILKQLENEDENDDYVCSVCDDENQADYYCENCSDLLCEDCVDAHKVVKYTKEHVIKKINSSTDMSKFNIKKYFCGKHDGEILDTFCLKCDQSICRQCVLSNHHGYNHVCTPIQNAVKACHETIRRKSFNFKSHTPNLHLALMDIKRIKKALREQVNSVRTEISESVQRLIAHIKNKEKQLYQNVDQVYKSKTNRLNAKKEKIVVELEKYEAITRIINQLERHDNSVELLQMKATIKNSIEILEKGESNLKVDKETFLLKSNEQAIKNEINKHGELYRIDEQSSGSDGKPSRSEKGSIGNRADIRNNVLISDFEDNASNDGVNDEQNVLAKIVLSSNALSKAKKLRAKGNWLIVRSRIRDIIKYGALHGMVVRKPRKRRQSDLYTNRLRRSKAKALKAKANWLLIRSHLPEVVKNKPPPKIAKRRLLDVTNIWSDHLRKSNKRKTMRWRAVKQRANANWLLVRSRIRDIVDYGRVTGSLTYNAMQIINSSKFRRNRDSRTILKLKHYRAIHMRAHANWLLVAAKLKDIAEYPERKKRDKNKKTWGEFRKDLVSNRNKASRNKEIAGSIRAHANWLIVKTRFPDIILFGKFRDYANISEKDKFSKNKDTNRTTRPVKQRSGDKKKRSNSSSPSKAHVNWDSLLRTTPPMKKSEKKEDKPLKSKDNKNKHNHPPISSIGRDDYDDNQHKILSMAAPLKESSSIQALDDWDNLLKPQNLSKKKSKSVGDLHQPNESALKEWGELIKGEIRKTNRQKPSSTAADRRPPLGRKGSRSTDSLDSKRKQKASDAWKIFLDDDESETTKTSNRALDNWDDILKETPSKNKRKSKSTSSIDSIGKENELKNFNKNNSDKSDTDDETNDVLRNRYSLSKPKPKSKIPLAKLSSTSSSSNKSKPDSVPRFKNESKKMKPDKEIPLRAENTPDASRKPKADKAMQNRDKIAEKCWDVLIEGTKVDKKENNKADEKWHDVKVSLGKADNLDSFDEADSNWKRLIEDTVPEKEQKEKQEAGNNITNAFRNWGHLVNETDVSPSVKALKNWDTLVTSTEPSSDEIDGRPKFNRVISHNDNVTRDSYNHWSNLINGINMENDDQKMKNWEHLLSNTYTKDDDDDEALNHWKELVQPSKSKEEIKALKHWDKLIEGRIIRTKPQVQAQTLEKNWDVLVASPQAIKSPAPSRTSQTSGKSSVFNNWHKLTTKTPPLPKRKGSTSKAHDEAHKNWNSLINDSVGSKDELAFDNWDALLSANNSFEPFNGSKPPGVETLFEKYTPKSTKSKAPEAGNKVLSLNIRNSKGEFHNVNLKLSSPDKSILSAHVAENTDGTFTIFCCPRIDNDFNMFVSLSGEQFKHEIKVVNFYGSFAGIRKNEVDLACRTISLLRWHLTPGLLTKKGDKIVARKGSIK